ncbi:MAG: hypothetical protein WCV72_01875 [Patescibacteria group bacterium]|jgi:hypothetical protein
MRIENIGTGEVISISTGEVRVAVEKALSEDVARFSKTMDLDKAVATMFEYWGISEVAFSPDQVSCAGCFAAEQIKLLLQKGNLDIIGFVYAVAGITIRA